MHNVQLSDQLYHEVQRRAVEGGFPTVDDYTANVLQQELDGQTDDLDRLFTPERLAQIDRAIAQIEAGQGLTTEQARAELARRREEWLRQNPS